MPVRKLSGLHKPTQTHAYAKDNFSSNFFSLYVSIYDNTVLFFNLISIVCIFYSFHFSSKNCIVVYDADIASSYLGAADFFSMSLLSQI